jgi:AMIN domain
LLRAGSQLAAVALLAVNLPAAVSAQSSPLTQPPAVSQNQEPTALIRSVKVAPRPENAAVEIITTRPMVPVISVLESPPRLVIDLPMSLVNAPQRISSRNQQIRDVRVNQFQKDPPSVRVVVDLASAADYSWDEAGNRLMVRLRPPGEPSAAISPGVVTSANEPKTAAEAVVLASTRTVLNSSVSARAESTVLRLERGGEVRVCPGTTISVTHSRSSREVMLAMSTGALEAHYRLQSPADSVLTPDFRIVPSGTGEFDYAISADSKGNTCVRSLPGNTASAVVSELMGEGTYRVKPSEEIVFRGGGLMEFDTAVPADCGCPVGAIPVVRASAALAEDRSPFQSRPPVITGETTLSSSSETASLHSTQSAAPAKHIHVQVDAPLVFRASDPQPTPAESLQAAELPLAGPEGTNLLNVTVLPPQRQPQTSTAQPKRPGFLGRMKGFLERIFR